MKGKCMCVQGFGGKDCSEVTGNSELCPDECSGHGSCALGKCFCDPGWGGKGCNFKRKLLAQKTATSKAYATTMENATATLVLVAAIALQLYRVQKGAQITVFASTPLFLPTWIFWA